MENLAIRIRKHFNIKLEKAIEVAKDTLIVYSVIQDRLKRYTEDKKSFDWVVSELDGYNVEESAFDIEYNDLQLVIEYRDGVFSIGVPVVLHVTNDEGIEPLEIDLEVVREAK